ncbi:hypothetical protein [Streptomyces ureilyticus]|uniref:Uncharacterized protein n=1 Tax=Streptomyces ureilyticus TaxID=1775131 RepID=A0ABX0DPG7_9ACTN|nr:hypothetical protein [Streptomyces ureilyticus]NGO43768.1 hypothetical protein [Streptomyces ureilyticus]
MNAIANPAERAVSLAKEFEARAMLRAILAEHDLTLLEVRLDELVRIDPELAARFTCWVAEGADGRKYVVVPEWQDPIERLYAVASYLTHRERAA